MKRLVFASGFVATASIASLAADLPGSAPVLAPAPLIIQSHAVNGFYFSASAGFNWLDKSSGNAVLGPSSGGGFLGAVQPFRVVPETGFVVIGSIGWGFGNGLRVEAELSHRNNDVKSFQINGSTSNPHFGSVSTTGAMVIALYDIGATMGWPVHITVGGGIGYAWHDWNGVGGVVAGTTNRISDTAGSFAYQLISGLSFPIRAVPGLALTADYRYFATPNTSKFAGSYVFGGGTGSETVRVRSVNQSVLVGVRYNLNPPPATVLA